MISENGEYLSSGPVAFAYVYPDGSIRFDTAGEKVNGSAPTKTVTLYAKAQIDSAYRLGKSVMYHMWEQAFRTSESPEEEEKALIAARQEFE